MNIVSNTLVVKLPRSCKITNKDWKHALKKNPQKQNKRKQNQKEKKPITHVTFFSHKNHPRANAYIARENTTSVEKLVDS